METTKGGRTRQRILETVANLLGEHSFDQISIAEITRRAEVTRPAFYFHFPSKGAAVAAILEELFEEFITVADAWYEHPSGDPLAGIPEALDATINLWQANARLMHGMAQAAAVDREAGELWRSWIHQFSRRASERLQADLTLGTDGEAPSADALAEVLVGATFDAMQRDVRRIVELGEKTPEIGPTLAYVWSRALGRAV
jgi:AcrR family transcriptional regulator